MAETDLMKIYDWNKKKRPTKLQAVSFSFLWNYLFIKSSISSISIGMLRIKLNGSPLS